MTSLLSFFETRRKNKTLFEVAKQLQNSEFKRESAAYVMHLLTNEKSLDDYPRF